MDAPPPLPARAARLAALEGAAVDVAVVGGGITGAGVALDLRLRGLEVALLEAGDWASHTSSASSRLVHGGLRYLEQLEIGLVRESCLERALLLRNAAGLVWPEHFVFPVRRTDRVGRVKLAAGLWLYTLLSTPRALGLPGLVSRAGVRRWLPDVRLDALKGGGTYLDAATDDARLTLAVVLSAIRAGATCLSRTEVTAVETAEGGARLALLDALDGSERALSARAVVLAGGPGTEALRGRAGLAGRWLSPTRGSHVLVPRRRLPTEGAVIFPSHLDGRVMFLIPWPRYTVIGTTDLNAEPDVPPRATREEVRYLLESANGLTRGVDLTEADVVSTWSGLRPLLAAPEDDPSARSREERVAVEGPVFTIAGGKLTGYRSMAEKLGAQVAQALGKGDASRRSPTRSHALWGALPRPVTRPAWSTPGHPGDVLEYALNRRYGRLARVVRDHCRYAPGAGRELDPETLLGELDWALTHEDCLRPADFFLRRTDLGYGPRELADASVEPVLDRMGRALDWGEAEFDAARAELDEELDRRHAWTED